MSWWEILLAIATMIVLTAIAGHDIARLQRDEGWQHERRVAATAWSLAMESLARSLGLYWLLDRMASLIDRWNRHS